MWAMCVGACRCLSGSASNSQSLMNMHIDLCIFIRVSIHQATFKFTHVQPLFSGLSFRLQVDVELFNSKRVRDCIILCYFQ